MICYKLSCYVKFNGRAWGWQWGGAGSKDGVFAPARMVSSYPLLAPPTWWKKFSFPIPTPWGPANPPSYSVKLYFLLIWPQLLQLFLIKLVSLIKIYLKLQINLSHPIKLIFSKNWIVLLKCLTRQYHNKNKNLIIQNQWFNSI